MMKVFIYQDERDDDGQRAAAQLREDIQLDVMQDMYDVPVEIVYVGELPSLLTLIPLEV